MKTTAFQFSNDVIRKWTIFTFMSLINSESNYQILRKKTRKTNFSRGVCSSLLSQVRNNIEQAFSSSSIYVTLCAEVSRGAEVTSFCPVYQRVPKSDTLVTYVNIMSYKLQNTRYLHCLDNFNITASLKPHLFRLGS